MKKTIHIYLLSRKDSQSNYIKTHRIGATSAVLTTLASHSVSPAHQNLRGSRLTIICHERLLLPIPHHDHHLSLCFLSHSNLLLKTLLEVTNLPILQDDSPIISM